MDLSMTRMNLWRVVLAAVVFMDCESALTQSSQVVSLLARSRRYAVDSSLTDEDRKLYLDGLNDVRRNTTGRNMNKLYWSNSLAELARVYSLTCGYAMEYLDRGQVQFSYSNYPRRFPHDALGRNVEITENNFYKVAVWASAMEVGCSVKFCRVVQALRDSGYFLVCNFNPVGNPLEPPYILGEPCSGCPGLACDGGLCDWKASQCQRSCDPCHVPGYDCCQCSTSYTDPHLWEACTTGMTNFSVVPHIASIQPNTYTEVNIRDFDSVFHKSGHFSIRMTADIGGSQGERRRILATKATRSPQGLSFTATSLDASVEGIPWQLSVVINSTWTCELGQTLTFYGEPTITSIHPRRTVLSGGTRVTVAGNSLAAVDQAVLLMRLMYISQQGIYSNFTFTGDCPFFENESIICITPVVTLPSIIPTPTTDQSNNSNRVNNDQLLFDVNVVFDGTVTPVLIDGEDDCGGICVYHNPYVEQWNPPIKDYRKTVAIQGMRLNLGAGQDDYHITVGDGGSCRVTRVTWNLLHCEPPVASPALIQGSDAVDGVPRVVLNVGFLTFHVGNIRYGDDDSPVPLIAGCVVGGLVLIYVIFAGALYYFYRKSKDDNSRSAEEISPRRLPWKRSSEC